MKFPSPMRALVLFWAIYSVLVAAVLGLAAYKGTGSEVVVRFALVLIPVVVAIVFVLENSD